MAKRFRKKQQRKQEAEDNYPFSCEEETLEDVLEATRVMEEMEPGSTSTWLFFPAICVVCEGLFSKEIFIPEREEQAGQEVDICDVCKKRILNWKPRAECPICNGEGAV